MKRSALLTLLAIACVLGAGSPGKIVEPVTGKSFDAQVQGVTSGVTLTCTGAGCRKKTMLGVKVYAIAHWIDAKGAASALSEWKGKSAKDLAADQRFYDAISAADVEKRLTLVFERDVDAAAMRGAFEESLNIVLDKKLPPSAKDFLQLFKSDVKSGQSIELRSLPGGVIEAQQNGAVLGRLPADPTLARAVWGIYFHGKLADSYLEAVKPQLISEISTIW